MSRVTWILCHVSS